MWKNVDHERQVHPAEVAATPILMSGQLDSRSAEPRMTVSLTLLAIAVGSGADR